MAFYIVKNTGFYKTGFAYGEDFGKVNTGSAKYCAECKSPLTMLEWLAPLYIKVSKGKLGDVIFGTFCHFLVSEKFKEIYISNDFKGILTFEPVTLFRKGEKLLDKYFYPKISLSDAKIDINKSEIVFDGVEECTTCQKAGRVIKKINGLYLLDETNIKDDIFCTKMLPGDILFSEKFVVASKELSNLSLFFLKNLFRVGFYLNLD